MTNQEALEHRISVLRYRIYLIKEQAARLLDAGMKVEHDYWMNEARVYEEEVETALMILEENYYA